MMKIKIRGKKAPVVALAIYLIGVVAVTGCWLAFLRHDRVALHAARERLVAVPEPANWAEQQRLFREQTGQEMRWPRNIEATDMLLACFGKPYPLWPYPPWNAC